MADEEGIGCSRERYGIFELLAGTVLFHGDGGSTLVMQPSSSCLPASCYWWCCRNLLVERIWKWWRRRYIEGNEIEHCLESSPWRSLEDLASNMTENVKRGGRCSLTIRVLSASHYQWWPKSRLVVVVEVIEDLTSRRIWSSECYYGAMSLVVVAGGIDLRSSPWRRIIVFLKGATGVLYGAYSLPYRINPVCS